MSGESELIRLFSSLVSTPSPSGSEANVAAMVSKELSRLGIGIRVDRSSRRNASSTGNIIATVPGGRQKLMFIAHMDTVESGARRIKPVISNGAISSDGNTILGADNKAGVAPLIMALGDISRMERIGRPTVVGIFSTREEEGTMGVSFLPRGNGSELMFVLDSEGPVGEFVNRALGSTLFDIEILGREAHAALNPEKGANAVKAAGLMISELKLGKRRGNSILNVGMISGGRKRNVIPGSATLKCATRAFDTGTIKRAIAEVHAAARKACSATGCTYKLRMVTNDGAPPFRLAAGERAVRLARYAASSLGISFSVSSRMATFEANILAGRGYKPLVMCQGGMMPHSTQESIRVCDLSDTRRLIVEMARRANALR